MIDHTKNETTVEVGQCVATVIADTIRDGKRITTLELVYPRYIHSEFMTHRMFSRNASSSRATPLKVTLSEVRNDPVFFDFVGKNKAGMVATEPLSEQELKEFEQEWTLFAKLVAARVEHFAEKYQIHKQTLNRALEPFLRIKTLVTATEWDNFFKLRLAPDAQPEIKSLAVAMQKAMETSTPVEGMFHLPYIENYDPNSLADYVLYTPISVARCARVSYARLDGRPDNEDDDRALFNRLKNSGHMSPFEHVAVAYGGRYANFVGWKSYRNQQESAV